LIFFCHTRFLFDEKSTEIEVLYLIMIDDNGRSFEQVTLFESLILQSQNYLIPTKHIEKRFPGIITAGCLRSRVKISQGMWNFSSRDCIQTVGTEALVDGGIAPLIHGANIVPPEDRESLVTGMGVCLKSLKDDFYVVGAHSKFYILAKAHRVFVLRISVQKVRICFHSDFVQKKSRKYKPPRYLRHQLASALQAPPLRSTIHCLERLGTSYSAV